VRLYRRQGLLRQRLAAAGFAPDAPVTMLMTGRSAPLLAVFDRDTLQLKALLRTDGALPGVRAR